jgi:hypothetical protein
MDSSAVSNTPAFRQIKSQLSGEVARTNIAYAVAAKQINVNKQVAQAALELLDTASQIGPSQTPGRGIDVKA